MPCGGCFRIIFTVLAELFLAVDNVQLLEIFAFISYSLLSFFRFNDSIRLKFIISNPILHLVVSSHHRIKDDQFTNPFT
jgi:hypothetical protein